MSTQNATQQKFLINCQDGQNNVERATISFILAVTASKTAETAVFVSSDASKLLKRGALDGLVADGYEPLPKLVDDFLGNGGKIWLCPACARANDLAQDDLIEGVEIAGAPRTMAFVASGAQLLA